MFTLNFALRTAMAACAMVDVCNALLAMFGDGPRRLVRVATVTSVALEIAAEVTGCAIGIVMPVENEKAAMIKCRGLPVRRLMTGCAGCRFSAMQLVARCLVTGLAAAADIRFQYGVIKGGRLETRQSRTRVVTVASHAIRLAERLMEGWSPLPLADRDSFGRT